MKERLGSLVPSTVLLLIVFLLVACGATPDADADEQIEIVSVERGPLTVSITAVGSVSPRAEAKLSFGTGGEVSDVLVRAGGAPDSPHARLDDQVVDRDRAVRRVGQTDPVPVACLQHGSAIRRERHR